MTHGQVDVKYLRQSVVMMIVIDLCFRTL